MRFSFQYKTNLYQLQFNNTQYQTTENYNQAKATIHEDYIDHLTLARVAFKKDVPAQTALGLHGNKNQSETGYCSQALL